MDEYLELAKNGLAFQGIETRPTAAALISIAESLAKLVEFQEAEKEKERQFWSKKAALDLDNPVGIVPQEIAQRIVEKFAKDGK